MHQKYAADFHSSWGVFCAQHPVEVVLAFICHCICSVEGGLEPAKTLEFRSDWS
jgi:hypothetical protein